MESGERERQSKMPPLLCCIFAAPFRFNEHQRVANQFECVASDNLLLLNVSERERKRLALSAQLHS